MLGVRRGDVREALAVDASRRPVLLATLDVPFDERAAAFAVDAAVECGQTLVVANVVEIPLAPLCLNLGYGPLEPDAVQESLRAPAALAHDLGVEVERVRIRSPHQIAALLEFVGERRPSLLVFGPQRALLRPRTFRSVAKKIRERTDCLVWLPD
jgi:nucleotide-binding universal stress UspA family protein